MTMGKSASILRLPFRILKTIMINFIIAMIFFIIVFFYNSDHAVEQWILKIFIINLIKYAHCS